MTAIIDYGVGNLFSLSSSLRALGETALVTDDPNVIRRSARIILPGVGAFGDAAELLRRRGMDRVVLEEASRGKPLMGICLGMQLLFERSYEFGEHEGLGLLHGEVVDMQGRLPPELKIPQIGWNGLLPKRPHPLLRDVEPGDCVYFVHSYYAENCGTSLLATTDYGRELTAMVARENVMGCQFHPEKSGKTGLSILKAFCEMGKEA
ncbi:MAG: imidazole glycerol phosphate synthase subunit HisH [Oscillospiraceae bacterium]|nr:imidazole glycerol phosphate synthase subunit HisH [Oscillospiraceae bacterium]